MNENVRPTILVMAMGKTPTIYIEGVVANDWGLGDAKEMMLLTVDRCAPRYDPYGFNKAPNLVRSEYFDALWPRKPHLSARNLFHVNKKGMYNRIVHYAKVGNPSLVLPTKDCFTTYDNLRYGIDLTKFDIRYDVAEFERMYEIAVLEENYNNWNAWVSAKSHYFGVFLGNDPAPSPWKLKRRQELEGKIEIIEIRLEQMEKKGMSESDK